jgi:4-hydroxy-tetrahydrodipicolinate synthase
MKTHLVEGTYTALVTPFQDDEAKTIDWLSVDHLVDAQLDAGIDGLVPCGTTGESPALTAAEQSELVRRVVARANGRARVVAGTGTNATATSIERSRDAERAGVDAVMLVVPYYNKPTQEGLYRHFVAVAASVRCPVVIYNIPARSGIDLATDTLGRICEAAPNVIAVKEATGNVLRAQELVRRFGDQLSILSGDDALTLPILAVGGRGVISVTSNLLPEHVGRMTKLALDGRIVEARSIHLSLLPVHEAMFIESNPSPVKAALAMRGRMKDVVRGPLVPASEGARQKIGTILDEYTKGAMR